MNENFSRGRPTPDTIPAPNQGGIGKRPVVVALHCSGADGSQWRKLNAALAPDFAVVSPDFIGANAAVAWHGQRDFTLADEAERILSVIEACPEPVHLVGHSYGGGVALRIAMSSPSRIASLSLYEPSAFHLLRELGPSAVTELAEIEGLAGSIVHRMGSGDHAEAAATFVDYWNGDGAWSALREDVRASMLRWMPYAAVHFHALLSEMTPLAAVRLDCPVLVMRGEHALPPSRLLAETIARAMSDRPVECISGAGHMGPITHADAVNMCIAAHLAAAEAAESSRFRRDAA